jgi:hypothetical protein
MKQTIQIKPPKGYHWVRVGERFRLTDLYAHSISFDGKKYAGAKIEWRPITSYYHVYKNKDFQSYIRKDSQ